MTVDPDPANVTKLQATISVEETANKCLDEPEANSPTLSLSKKRKKRKKLRVENGVYDVEGSEVGASSTLLCSGLSDVFNPPSTPPRSAGESALS